MEKIEGVERAEVDWKGKQAEVFANADGFDPAELPDAVRKAGFAPPDAEVGIDVSVIGNIEARAEGIVLLLPSHQWQLIGDGLDELRGVDRSKALRLRGAFTMGRGGQPPKLKVAAWEALSDS